MTPGETASADDIKGYCGSCGEPLFHLSWAPALCLPCLKQDNARFWAMWVGTRIPSHEEQAQRTIDLHQFDWRTGKRYTDRRLLCFAVSDVPGYLCWCFPHKALPCLHYRTLWQKVSADGAVFYATGAQVFGSRVGIVEYLLLEPLTEEMQRWFESEVRAQHLFWFEEGAWEGQREEGKFILSSEGDPDDAAICNDHPANRER